jgi:beta-glucosidase
VRMWDGTGPRQNADGHKDVGGSPWPGSEHVEFLVQDGPYTAMGWNIAPDGLEDLLVSLNDKHPGLPLVITENGAAFDDDVVDGEVRDVERTDYLRRHFTAAHRAIERGVDLRGYLVWSLLDNFEWGYGYSKRFGIVHVDYDTQERTVKDSGKWLGRLIAGRSIPE